jgi:uncharacterized membrane protein YciS (DUF1049 family)
LNLATDNKILIFFHHLLIFAFMTDKEDERESLRKIGKEEFLRWKRRTKILERSSDRISLICGDTSCLTNPKPLQMPSSFTASVAPTQKPSAASLESSNICSPTEPLIEPLQSKVALSETSLRSEPFDNWNQELKQVEDQSLKRRMPLLRKVTLVVITVVAVLLGLKATLFQSVPARSLFNLPPLLILFTVEFGFGLINFCGTYEKSEVSTKDRTSQRKLSQIPPSLLATIISTLSPSSASPTTSKIVKFLFYMISAVATTLLDVGLFLFWSILTISLARVFTLS